MSSERLRLPQITTEPSPPSRRSLDEIDQWIEEDYAELFDRESYERRKRELSVNRPFRLP